jgi:hypothetical protein
MKTLLYVIIIFLTISSDFIYSQQVAPVAANFDYLISAYGEGGYMSVPTSSTIYPANSDFAKAAEIDASGNLILKSSQANINNRIADRLAIDNDIHRTETWFRKRQTNKYYVTLENWQKKEVQKLKREGSLTKEDINYIFDR